MRRLAKKIGLRPLPDREKKFGANNLTFFLLFFLKIFKMDVIFILFLENKVDDGLYVTLLFF